MSWRVSCSVWLLMRRSEIMVMEAIRIGDDGPSGSISRRRHHSNLVRGREWYQCSHLGPISLRSKSLNHERAFNFMALLNYLREEKRRDKTINGWNDTKMTGSERYNEERQRAMHECKKTEKDNDEEETTL